MKILLLLLLFLCGCWPGLKHRPHKLLMPLKEKKGYLPSKPDEKDAGPDASTTFRFLPNDNGTLPD